MIKGKNPRFFVFYENLGFHRLLRQFCLRLEVTVFILERVGDTGSVTGIDVNQQLLDIARSQNQFDNVSFLNRDIYHLEELGTYDAIVGRRVLMYLPDAVKAIKALAQHLTTGGVIAFQESDALNSGYGGDALPLHQLALKRVLQTIEQEVIFISGNNFMESL